jgi:subtilisin family serine protease
MIKLKFRESRRCSTVISVVGAGLLAAACSYEEPVDSAEQVGATTGALTLDSGASAAADATDEAAAVVANKYFVGLKPQAARQAAADPAAIASAGSAVPLSPVAIVGRNLEQRHGGKVHRAYQHAVQALAMELSAAQLESLKADPDVAYVEPVPVRRTGAMQIGAVWGLDRLDQRPLSLDYTYTSPNGGAAIVHAYVLDTGAYAQHTAFGGRVTGGWNFISNNNDTSDWDVDGHGTHVAGTIGSSTWGVAKQVQLHPLKVCGVHGMGICDDIAIVAALDWLVANHQSPAVANMSISGPSSQTEDNAVNAAIASGVTLVTIAGNNGGNACNYGPGDLPNPITVASVDKTDTRAPDSNFGTCVDLFAPGVNITSAGLTQGSSAVMSGTSMAAPHVTGVAALYLALNPKATPSAVAAALLAQATPGIVQSPGAGSPNLLLYEGFLNAGPCDGLCSNPTSFSFAFNSSYSSGNLGTGASCRATASPVTGGNCGNFASGRTLKVNGVTKACNGQTWAAPPVSRNGGYCVQTTAGDYSWAYFSLWSSP